MSAANPELPGHVFPPNPAHQFRWMTVFRSFVVAVFIILEISEFKCKLTELII